MEVETLNGNELNRWKNAGIVFLFCAVTTIPSHAQIFRTLANFGVSATGTQPNTFIRGFDGNSYGTTVRGVGSGQCQSYYCGTVFRMTPAGKLTTVYSFCTQANCPDGEFPSALLQATDGNLYGVTSDGGAGCRSSNDIGCGTVFRINSAGKLTTLYNFCVQTNCPDGAGPTGLMQAADGALYGTTYGGGANGFGTVFKITPAGKFVTLHSFNNTDGANPAAGVTQGRDGNFYGTAWQGGNLNCAFSGFFLGCGTIFEMTPRGSFKTLYAFCVESITCADGSSPSVALVQGADGSLYGTTLYGGYLDFQTNCDYDGCGTIFSITPGGKLTTVYTFCSLRDLNCVNGYFPSAALVQGTDGNLWGTAYEGGDLLNGNCGNDGCGTIFEITPSGTLTTLHTFEYADGGGPGPLLQSTNGTFYGTTQLGGSGLYGTIFSLATGLGPFVEADPAGGKMGAKVIITGTNLTGITSVTFNGTAASFTVAAKTKVIANVPAGATTGFIQVTTPSGTLKSNAPFQVIP